MFVLKPSAQFLIINSSETSNILVSKNGTPVASIYTSPKERKENMKKLNLLSLIITMVLSVGAFATEPTITTEEFAQKLNSNPKIVKFLEKSQKVYKHFQKAQLHLQDNIIGKRKGKRLEKAWYKVVKIRAGYFRQMLRAWDRRYSKDFNNIDLNLALTKFTVYKVGSIFETPTFQAMRGESSTEELDELSVSDSERSSSPNVPSSSTANQETSSAASL